MNGLKLSKDYFNEVILERLKESFPDVFPRLAAGLVGNGSECFGYDDEISRDHDWGIDFFIWVTDADAHRIQELSAWKNTIMTFYPPSVKRNQSEYGAHITVMTCKDFYKQLIGIYEYPVDPTAWFRIPEANLAMCVNGEVFLDNAGEFSEIRNSLKKYFHEDYRLKKISAKCMAIAQTGQYNHKRMNDRCEYLTVNTVISRFIDNVTGLVYLLNKVYRPYYKWENRMMRSLPILGNEINELFINLLSLPTLDTAFFSKRQSLIDDICAMLLKELQNQQLTDSDDWFFTTHGEQVRLKISNQLLRSLPAQYE